MHTLGIAGNYTLPLHLQNTLTNYGLQIQHLGHKHYAVTGTHNDVDIDQLCPDTIARDGNVFELNELLKFSNFLHQPIRAAIENQIPKVDKAAGLRARRAQTIAREQDIHDKRTAAHRMLRFAITGSVEIPPDIEENLEKDTAECHASTEQAMRDEDTWKSEIEFGNPEKKISALPNTKFDTQSGFHITIPENRLPLQGANQEKLDKLVWDIINQSTDGKYLNKGGEITLSGSQLQNLTRLAVESDVASLIDAVEFEEAVQEKIASIQDRKQKGQIAPDTLDAQQHLNAVMHATSSLSPVISSAFMKDAWAKYNFTERHASPLDSIQKEVNTFLAVCDQHLKYGRTTPEDIEAIATEFYSLIAFAGHMVDALDTGLEKQLKSKEHTEEITELREKYAELKNIFTNASTSGVHLDPSFLSEEQQDTLKTMKRFAGKQQTISKKIRSAVQAPLSAGADTFIDFTGDVINFVREDPKIATGFVALSAALIANTAGGDASAVNQMCSGYTINDAGEFVLTAIENCESLPEDLFGQNNFHWDIKFSPITGYELYKHFANANFIVGPSQAFMEGIRSSIHTAYAALDIPVNYDNHFDRAANSVIDPLATKLFAINMFQNVSHAAFWMWAFSRGYEHGPKGFSKLFELSAPITDLTVHAGTAVIDQFKEQAKLSELLAGLPQDPQTELTYQSKITPGKTLKTIAAIAEKRDEISEEIPAGILPYDGTTSIDPLSKSKKIDGLTREFTLHAGNYKPTLDALQKLDQFMSHASGSVLAEENWHTQSVRQHIKSIQNALENYATSNNAEELTQVLDKSLEYVLASEMRYRDKKSEIYEALFEASPDKDAAKRLIRSANANVGIERRANHNKLARQALMGQGEQPLKATGHLSERAKIAATNIWDKTIKTAHLARRASDKTLNKRNVVVLSAIAATCTGLDLAGSGNDFSNAVSGLTGGTIASATTTATFLNFNFWEDIVGVHIGTGIGLMFAGAATGATYKHAIHPAISTALETKVGSYMQEKWKNTSKSLRSISEKIADKIDQKNTQWGEQLTQRALTI